jgi:hypothetical protein
MAKWLKLKESEEYLKMSELAVYKAVLLLVLLTSSALAQEWTEVQLSGIFRGRGTADGEGEVEYSFGLKKVVEQGGDIRLQLSFYDYPMVGFRLIGCRCADLGAIKEGPQSINLESLRDSEGHDFTHPNWNNPDLTLGHSYILRSGDVLAVIHPLSFDVTDMKVIEKHWYGNKIEASAVFRFRYISSDRGLDELNGLLSGKMTKQLPKSQQTADSYKPSTTQKPDSTSKTTKPAIVDQDPLLKDYEQFQIDSKSFIDSKPPQATVKACDALLNHAAELDTNIETLLIVLGADIKSMEVKIKTLEDRLQTTSNLQIKDRIQTLITSLKKQKEENEQKQREWAARRKELLDAKRTLYDYRGVLEIMESK